MDSYLESLLEQIATKPFKPSYDVVDRLDTLYQLLTEDEIQEVGRRMGAVHRTSYYRDLDTAVEPHRSICLGNIRRILFSIPGR